MIKTFFIDSSQANYDSSEFSFLQTLLMEEGVLGDSAGTLGLQVTQNSPLGMSVLVSAGNALIELTKNGATWKIVLMNNAQAALTIAANSSGANRVDAVIARVDKDAEPNALKNNIGTLEVVAGTGTSPLSDGAIDAVVGSDGWIRLANVTVANNATQIVTGNIADTRAQVKSNDAVRPAPKQIAFTVLAADPVSPTEGLLWYNSTSHTLNYYNGTTTVTVLQVSASVFISLAVEAQSVPDMTVKVSAGVANITGTIVKYAGGNSGIFSAPVSNSRIDLLMLNSGGTLDILQGTPGASPSAPAYPIDKLVLAEIYLKSTSTSIKNTTDGTNGYISKDARPLVLPHQAVTYKNGTTTRTGNAASGSQTIAHGLGVVPKYVKISARKFIAPSSANLINFPASDGVYNGSTTSCVYYFLAGGITNTSSFAGTDTTNIIHIFEGIDSGRAEQVATITIDATNITLAWTKTGTPAADNIQLLWEAFA